MLFSSSIYIYSFTLSHIQTHVCISALALEFGDKLCLVGRALNEVSTLTVKQVCKRKVQCHVSTSG